MKARLPDGTTIQGRGIDLSAFDIDADSVVDSIRCSTADQRGLHIDCPDPGPGHDRLAVVPLPSFSRSHALAAAGRSRGLTTPVDDELDRIETRLADIESDTDTDESLEALRAARRRLATAGADEDRLRERVATLRGQLNAHRDADDEDAAAAVKTELVETTTKLSEVSTERIAAEQRLSTLEQDARRSRDTREERLRLQDALDNRRREARQYLADTLEAEFESAVRELHKRGADVADSRAEHVVPTLAAVKLADFCAPVVLTARFFSDASTAAQVLDTPVIRV
ncbi:hypothetical protein C455_15373 [Haloferax larsenii JCM 13917]|nr:hypothetical protein [Haloferax larsenii]ELZ76018.1 hypothetical protein C455_15373 [Haloferax larsenii JCM 13917]